MAERTADRSAIPYRARVWWGDRLLAESAAAVRVGEPGDVPDLYLPVGDVAIGQLRDEGRTKEHAAKGTARLWSIDAPAGVAPVPTPGTEWQYGDRSAVDGEDVMWSFTDPAPGFEWLSGLAAFDHERVRVELVDEREGDDPRDVSTKRFPVWGDARDLIGMLDVVEDGDGSYVSVTHPTPRRPVVEGSQMLAQAIVAAGRESPGRRVVSGHLVFTRAADTEQPLRFDLEELSAGRTFVTLGVQVSQSGRRCASAILLLDVTADDVIRHAAPGPAVAGPYDSEPCDMSVMGRDIRVVDAAYTDDPRAPVGPPVIDAWVRFRDVPDDQCMHAGLLAQFTGHMSIAAALRPHAGIGQGSAHRTLSTAINAIGISIHSEIRADRWMLYHHESSFAGAGMTHSVCRVHDEEGTLLASFVVDAMVRRFGSGSTSIDDRVAL